MNLDAIPDDQLAAIAGVSLGSDPTLAVKNNNPGNMKAAGGGFQQFDTPKAGLDAMQHDLTMKVTGNSPVMRAHYGDNYKPTLRNVISTWAPPSENSTENYINFVAKNSGIDPDQPLSAADVPKIMEPMIHMEGGEKASSYFSKLMGGIGDAIVPSAEAADALSSMSDDDLAKIAGVNLGGQNEGAQNSNDAAQGQSFGQKTRQRLAELGDSPFVNNTLEALHDTATQTGEMMSAAPSSMLSMPGKVLGAAGGAVDALLAPAKGALTSAVEASGAYPAASRLIKSNLVPTDPRFHEVTGPEAHDLAKTTGGDLTNALLSASMAKNLPKMPAGDIGTNLPGILGDTSGAGTGLPVPKIVKDESSGGKVLPFMKSPVPPSRSLTTTDSGKPLLITPKSISQGEQDVVPFLKDDGINLNKVADELEAAQKTNPNVTALDIMARDEGGIPGGANVLGLAKSIAQSPGQGRTLAAEMANRGYSATQRIGGYFDKGLSGADFYQSAEKLDKQMKGAGAAYAKAYANPTPISSPEIGKLLVKPAVKSAMQKAAQMAENDTGAIIAKDGSLTTQGVDYTKRALDDMIETAKRQGENNQVRILTGIKNKMLSEADRLNPDFATARKAFGDPASAADALEQGRGFMKMDPEEIAAFMKNKGTSNAEKMAFATGARRALQDSLDLKGETNPINALWKPNVQKRLQAIFPDQASYDSFAANMQHEKTMARVNGIMQGSPTFANQEFSKTPAKTLLGHGVRLASDPLAAVGNVTANFIDKRLAQQAQAMTQDSKTVAMRYLTTKDPQLLRDLATKTKE
jgi:hypothetical protein